jgi:hypothetical protein
LNKKASDKATSAQTQAAQQGLDWVKNVYGDSQGNFNPYIQGGQQGLQALLSNDFEHSPGYQYLKDEMVQGLDSSAANSFRLGSGGSQLAMAKHLNGLAAQDYGNWWNRQAGLAQMGQNAAAQLGSIGTGTGAQVSGLYGNIGNAQASGALTNANIYGNVLGGLAGLLGSNSASKTSSSYGPTSLYADKGYK